MEVVLVIYLVLHLFLSSGFAQTDLVAFCVPLIVVQPFDLSPKVLYDFCSVRLSPWIDLLAIEANHSSDVSLVDPPALFAYLVPAYLVPAYLVPAYLVPAKG